jgi:GNAT superfamily N-acetyltransferase
MPEGEKPQIALASSQEIGTIQILWREYWDALQLPPDFQNFDEELRTLPGVYTPPKGRLLIASIQGKPAGTAALRPLSTYACEAKRLYVCPQYRGNGVGSALLNRLLEEARGAGYQDMYADTLESMAPALQMYKQFGFSEVPPYSPNATPHAIFLRLSLRT